jgi:hypothetical protein
MQDTILPHALRPPGLSECDFSYFRDINMHLKALLSWYSINSFLDNSFQHCIIYLQK